LLLTVLAQDITSYLVARSLLFFSLSIWVIFS
jgi:hypothetical protein